MAKFPHITLGDLREMVAQFADKPDTMQVRLFLERGIGPQGQDLGSTYARVTSPLSFYAADAETPACLAIAIMDTGAINGEDTEDDYDDNE